jgi:hypothetical protein
VTGWGAVVNLTGPQGATGSPGATGAKGDTGATGATGSTGAAGADGKTVRSGSGAPSSGLGNDGDFYINTTTSALYGPKTAGVWGSAVSLVGPTGSTGSTGSTGAAGADGKTLRSGSGAPSAGLGNDGDFYINTAAWTIYGPKASGAWGSASSLVGPSTGTAGGVLTGTYPNPGLEAVPFAPATITYATTISADPTASNNFNVSATGNITSLGVSSTGAVDGQMVVIAVYASGSGSVTVTPATGTLGAQTIPHTDVGFFGFRYHAATSTFYNIAYRDSG